MQQEIRAEGTKVNALGISGFLYSPFRLAAPLATIPQMRSLLRYVG